MGGDKVIAWLPSCCWQAEAKREDEQFVPEVPGPSWKQVIERERKGGFCYGISTWIFTSHLSEYLHFKIKSHWRWGPAWITSSLGKTVFSAPVLSCGLFWKLLPVPWEPCAHLWAWLCADLLLNSHLRHLGEMPLRLELDEEPFPREAETSAAKFSWKPAVEPYLQPQQKHRDFQAGYVQEAMVLEHRLEVVLSVAWLLAAQPCKASPVSQATLDCSWTLYRSKVLSHWRRKPRRNQIRALECT